VFYETSTGMATYVLNLLRQDTLSISGKFRKKKEERSKRMSPSTKDQIKGNVHEMKGKVKEKTGQVTNNPDLAAEGQDENLAGKVQKKVGQIEKVFEK